MLRRVSIFPTSSLLFATSSSTSSVSSHRFNSTTGTGTGGKKNDDEPDIEDLINEQLQKDQQKTSSSAASATTEESSSSSTMGGFSKLRDSLHQGSESASVYSTPSQSTQASTRQRSVGFEDPTLADARFTRLYLEDVVDTDPIGGTVRSDYYRDPSSGFAPSHSPRNFAVGGSLDAHHALSPLHYEMQHQNRSDLDHSLESNSQYASAARQDLLSSSSSSSSSASQRMMVEEGERIFDSSHRESEDTSAQAFFDSAAAPRLARNVVGSRLNNNNNNNNEPSSTAALSWLDADSLLDRNQESHLASVRESELELFRAIHGQRDRERYEENRAEFYKQKNPGYDIDKIEARDKGRLLSRGLAPLIPPGSTNEAQSELRGNPNAVSDSHATWQQQAASNTTAASPLMGESLTEHLIETASARSRQKQRDSIDDYNTVTGRGRTNPLVSDAGPDQRTQQLGKNDERLLHAAKFAATAYRNGSDDIRGNSVYDQRTTDFGVAHLLNKHDFDRKRRQELLAKGQQDPLERSHMHLGVPLKEQIDDKVRARVNMRTHRPIEYFHPHPKASDMQLMEAHSDIEGFPLFIGRSFNIRLAPFEWDLFIRYRAHSAQRRAIALEHGLEPRPNESVAERAARRLKLDEICERTPFDPASFIQLDHGVEIVPARELRQWFGAYWLPSPSLCSLMLGKEIDTGVHLVDETRAGLENPFARGHHDVGSVSASSSNLTNSSISSSSSSSRMGSSSSSSSVSASGGRSTSASASSSVSASDCLLDDREHVLSQRYLNKLLTLEPFNQRLGRNSIKEQFLGRAPEVKIDHRVPESILKHFSPDQRRAYDEYVRVETEKHVKKWETILSGRRYLHKQNTFARFMKNYKVQVTTLTNVSSGEQTVVATHVVSREQNKNSSSSSSSSGVVVEDGLIILDGVQYSVDASSTRVESFVSVKTDQGAVLELLEAEWNTAQEEASPTGGDGSLDPNSHINAGTGLPHDFPYNRANYIETQDSLWETRIASGEEGWTTAVHPDGLKPGAVIRAKRVYASSSSKNNNNNSFLGGGGGVSDYQRAVVHQYQSEPYYNPHPRQVSVVFHDSVEPSKVPLSETLIWQSVWSGAERTMSQRTYRLSLGMKRFVNMQNPKKSAGSSSSSSSSAPHFLDRYLTPKQRAELSSKWRTSKSIGDIDNFSVFDLNRPHNHRLISGIGVRNYIRSGFIHRFTPWEFILTQEADAPIIVDQQLRGKDSTGPSHFFAPNRFWRFKRRPYGYIKNHAAEVRDLFQYVDAITPWDKAKQIRTHWEVREHHPIPAWIRPGLAAHRNTPQILPAHLWESDKKTGKIKALKDSLKDYKPLHVHPEWVKM